MTTNDTIAVTIISVSTLRFGPEGYDPDTRWVQARIKGTEKPGSPNDMAIWDAADGEWAVGDEITGTATILDKQWLRRKGDCLIIRWVEIKGA
jgi:hypothetical protein